MTDSVSPRRCSVVVVCLCYYPAIPDSKTLLGMYNKQFISPQLPPLYKHTRAHHRIGLNIITVMAYTNRYYNNSKYISRGYFDFRTHRVRIRRVWYDEDIDHDDILYVLVRCIIIARRERFRRIYGGQ